MFLLVLQGRRIKWDVGSAKKDKVYSLKNSII